MGFFHPHLVHLHILLLPLFDNLLGEGEKDADSESAESKVVLNFSKFLNFSISKDNSIALFNAERPHYVIFMTILRALYTIGR